MKILELAPYVYIEGHKHGSRNQSGLAYMIRSICDMLATKHEVQVLTQSILTKEMMVGGWCLLHRSVVSIIRHFKFRYLKLALQLNKKKWNIGFGKLLMYCLSAGQVEDYIKKWKPEVVHVHGIGMYTIPYYYAASYCNAPIVCTLHGLSSFSAQSIRTESRKRLEKDFLSMCIGNGYSMTFISSGMKKAVSEYYHSECNNIRVILNCFRTPANKAVVQNSNNPNELHLICVGSIGVNKNQIQVIRVLSEVQKRILTKEVVLDLYGDGEKYEDWKLYCKENDIKGVVFHGRVSQEEVFKALSSSDVLVFPSLMEGFGIPMAEAYSCGTPVVSFSDLDASLDLYNEDCTIFAKDRSDEALTEAIVAALSRIWDKEKIIQFSKRFTMESIGEQFCEEFAKTHKKWDFNIVTNFIKENINE